MELLPPPRPRPTLTHSSITVSDPLGYRPLHLDLHIPAGDGPFPVVFWVHGGGWQSGSRVWLPDTIYPFDFYERFIARGYAVADVDYRLAREAQYPAQLTDVHAAIRWVRHYTAEYRLDAARFATLGESAGGHLAAMAGLTGEGDTAIQAVIDWYGPSDFTTLRNLDDPATSPAVLFGGPINSRVEFAKWGSPVHRVHPGAPPFLLVHGTADTVVPLSQSEQLASALRGAGVRCDLITAEGADHCFEGYDDIGGLLDAGIDFLDDVLK
jgi:acetyl esterase/lipase